MTENEAASWMVEEFRRNGTLSQAAAASYLLQFHDSKLAFIDGASHVRIGRRVLVKFARLTPDAVFERNAKLWRRRFSGDRPGRLQSLV